MQFRASNVFLNMLFCPRFRGNSASSGSRGGSFPPSLAIHAVGAAAAQALQIDPRQNGIVYAQSLPHEMSRRWRLAR